MCTVTWILRKDGYELVANRDERRTRRPARPPRVQTCGRLRALAPVDGDADGTWIGVNERGVGLCLLNRHLDGEEAGDEAYRSRGLLVLELLASPTAADALDALAAAPLSAFRGFRLLVLEPGSAPVVRSWTGTSLRAEDEAASRIPLVSSSLDSERARREREATWDRMRAGHEARDPDLLLAYHRSHEPEAGPWSVCMHREDARTVSASRIRVGPEAALFRYAPGPPCRTPWRHEATLDLLR